MVLPVSLHTLLQAMFQAAENYGRDSIVRARCLKETSLDVYKFELNTKARPYAFVVKAPYQAAMTWGFTALSDRKQILDNVEKLLASLFSESDLIEGPHLYTDGRVPEAREYNEVQFAHGHAGLGNGFSPTDPISWNNVPLNRAVYIEKNVPADGKVRHVYDWKSLLPVIVRQENSPMTRRAFGAHNVKLLNKRLTGGSYLNRKHWPMVPGLITNNGTDSNSNVNI